MKIELTTILIEKGIIKEGTLIQAYHNVKGLSCRDDNKIIGDFIVTKAKKRQGEIVFEVLSDSNVKKEIYASDMLMVDGMDEPRLACAFMLKISGEKLPSQKKRGRKTKEEMYIVNLQNKSNEFTKLLNFGWTETDIIKKLNLSDIEYDEILDILETQND